MERNDQVVEAAPAIVAEEVARSLGDFRMADVATRLGVSERTLARYFGGRDGLVREAAAVRDASFASRMARAEGGATGLAAAATSAVRSDTAHVPLMRLAELAAEGRPSHVDGARRAAFGDVAAAISRELGAIEGIASEQLVLALIAIAAFPTAFPRWTAVITGSQPDTDEFRGRHRSAVDAIAERVTGRVRVGAVPATAGATGRSSQPGTVDLTGQAGAATGGIDLTGGSATAGIGTTAATPLASSTQTLMRRAAGIAEEQGAAEVTPAHLFAAIRAIAPEVTVRANSTSNGD